MLVDGKSETSVRVQLERIHKGETVEKIHEIIWDEEQIEEVLKKDQQDLKNFFLGTVKFFDQEKGFGFIRPGDEMDDLFFHKTGCLGDVPKDKDRVEFKVSQGPKGWAASAIKIIED